MSNLSGISSGSSAMGLISSHHHGGGRETYVSTQDRQRVRLDDRVGRALWCLKGEIAHLQEPHGQRRQQTQQADQTFAARPLSFFDVTARLKASVIVLHAKARTMPLDPRSCLFTTAAHQRCQQDPFERLFSSGRLFFPQTDDPDGQGRKFVETRIMARW